MSGWILGAALAAVAVAFAAAELAARAWIRARRQYFVWRPWERTRMRPDAEALPMLESETRFDINADGERGDPLPADLAHTYRVLVTGGSAAEGYFLDQASSWPGQLEELLNEPAALARLGARHAHVGNVARSLVPCEAIATMLERTLPRYRKLDLCLFMVGASDLVNWLERSCPPSLPEGEVPLTDMFDEHPERDFGWGLATLAMRQLASRLHRRLGRAPKLREHAGRRLVELRQRRRNAHEWIDSVPAPTPMLAHFEKHLRRAIEIARARAARVIIVRQPWFEKDFEPAEEALMWNFCVGKPYLELTTRYYTHRVVNELLHTIDERAAQVASELGIEQIDLMPALDRSLATYYDFLHFTPAGSQRVAAEIAAAVLRAPERSSTAPRAQGLRSAPSSSTPPATK